jgi:DNA-directed RNA polymerase subunit RPC12/RpoP
MKERAMKCPGQDTQFWTAEAIFEARCPQCDAAVEFFKDDTTRKCPQCSHRFVNPKMDFGCAAYCAYAEQCLGDLPPELVAQKEDLLKDRVAVAVKRHFKSDFKRIGRASRRARHVEAIGPSEGADLPVVLIAGYLWDLDDEAAEPGDLPRARAILNDLKTPEPLVERVCAILAHKREPVPDDDLNRRVAADADQLALMDEQLKNRPEDMAAFERRIDRELVTSAAKYHARKLFAV